MNGASREAKNSEGRDQAGGGRGGSIAVWAIAVVAVLWIMHTVTQYFARGITSTKFFREKQELGIELWEGWRAVLLVHAGCASVAIAAGVFAIAYANRRSWRWHRLVGRCYVIAVALSAATAVPLFMTSTGGWVATIGFVVLNAVWLYCTAQTYFTARQRDIRRHRVWFRRSAAVTMANTTLHVLTLALSLMMVDRVLAYTVSVWLCWPLNVLATEVYVWRRRAGWRPPIRKASRDAAE